MNEGQPRVSIVMFAYDARRYISVTIDSVLNKSEPDLELNIVDDCLI